MFSPRVNFSWKVHSAKILLCEIFSHEPFTARKFPNIRYALVPVLSGYRQGYFQPFKVHLLFLTTSTQAMRQSIVAEQYGLNYGN